MARMNDLGKQKALRRKMAKDELAIRKERARSKGVLVYGWGA